MAELPADIKESGHRQEADQDILPAPSSSSDSNSVGETLTQDVASKAESAALSASRAVPPAAIPGYQIQQRLGAGKFGSVWLARELNTGKRVAIKFYSQRRGVDWSLLSREVEKLAVLYTSRHIVGLIAVGWEHDPPYYVMEYLENGSLAQRLEQGAVSPSEAVRIITRVTQALAHAHQSGVLHCDVKPANVLLDQDHEPRLCDFGQSRLAHERSHALGTLFYMAPEQADLEATPNPRWDVYAIGALLYHLLVGEPPHRSERAEKRLNDAALLEDRLAIYRQLVETEGRPTGHRRMSGVDLALAEIIDRCLATDPRRRFPDATAVLERLHARERHRARRPLVLMGLIVPVVLVLSLFPFALDAMRDAISTSRSHLVDRALESDVLSAHLLAAGLQRELNDRIDELLVIAEDDDIREVLLDQLESPRGERGELMAKLDRAKNHVDARRKELGRSLDASWFVQDAQGFQRWRQPVSETIDRCFACRDYFHGLGPSYESEDEQAGDEHCLGMNPIHAPHVSAPYSSQSSARWKVALSVPIFDRPVDADGERRVIAVLARSLYLSSLLDDYQRGVGLGAERGVGRKLALIDGRSGTLLAHPWLTEDHLGKLSDFQGDLRLDADVNERLQQLLEHADQKESSVVTDRLTVYRDPAARFASTEFGGEWLAAFAKVGKTGWIAVVQEPRAPVMAPVDELRSRLLWSGILGMVVVCGVVGGGWWILLRAFSDGRPRTGRHRSSLPRDTDGRTSESA